MLFALQMPFYSCVVLERPGSVRIDSRQRIGAELLAHHLLLQTRESLGIRLYPDPAFLRLDNLLPELLSQGKEGTSGRLSESAMISPADDPEPAPDPRPES